jgi:hypothetical protein
MTLSNELVLVAAPLLIVVPINRRKWKIYSCRWSVAIFSPGESVESWKFPELSVEDYCARWMDKVGLQLHWGPSVGFWPQRVAQLWRLTSIYPLPHCRVYLGSVIQKLRLGIFKSMKASYQMWRNLKKKSNYISLNFRDCQVEGSCQLHI